MGWFEELREGIGGFLGLSFWGIIYGLFGESVLGLGNGMSSCVGA